MSRSIAIVVGLALVAAFVVVGSTDVAWFGTGGGAERAEQVPGQPPSYSDSEQAALEAGDAQPGDGDAADVVIYRAEDAIAHAGAYIPESDDDAGGGLVQRADAQNLQNLCDRTRQVAIAIAEVLIRHHRSYDSDDELPTMTSCGAPWDAVPSAHLEHEVDNFAQGNTEGGLAYQWSSLPYWEGNCRTLGDTCYFAKFQVNLADKGITRFQTGDFEYLNRWFSVTFANRDSDPSNDNTFTSIPDGLFPGGAATFADFSGIEGLRIQREDWRAPHNLFGLWLRDIGLTAQALDDGYLSAHEHLQRLDLSHNDIGSFQRDWIHDDARSRLRQLSLDNTGFRASTFAVNGFDGMTSLAWLELSHNPYMKYINMRWFRDLPLTHRGQGSNLRSALWVDNSRIVGYFNRPNDNEPNPAFNRPVIDFNSAPSTSLGSRLHIYRDDGTADDGEEYDTAWPHFHVKGRLCPSSGDGADCIGLAGRYTVTPPQSMNSYVSGQSNNIPFRVVDVCAKTRPVRDAVINRLATDPDTRDETTLQSGMTYAELAARHRAHAAFTTCDYDFEVVDLGHLNRVRWTIGDSNNPPMDLSDIGLRELTPYDLHGLTQLFFLELGNFDDNPNNNNRMDRIRNGIFKSSPSRYSRPVRNLSLRGVQGIVPSNDWWVQDQQNEHWRLFLGNTGLEGTQLPPDWLDGFTSLRYLDLGDMLNLKAVNVRWFKNLESLGEGGFSNDSVRFENSGIDFYYYSNTAIVPAASNRCNEPDLAGDFMTGGGNPVNCPPYWDGQAIHFRNVIRDAIDDTSDVRINEGGGFPPIGVYNICDRTRAVAARIARDLVDSDFMPEASTRAIYAGRTLPDSTACNGANDQWGIVNGRHLALLDYSILPTNLMNLNLPGVRSLLGDSSFTGLTGLQAGDFAGLRALQHLSLWGNPITQEGMPAGIFTGTDLQALEMFSAHLHYPDSAWFENAAAAAKMVRFSFVGGDMRPGNVPHDAFDAYPNLDRVNFAETTFGPVNLRWFKEWRNLGTSSDSDSNFRLNFSDVEGWYYDEDGNVPDYRETTMDTGDDLVPLAFATSNGATYAGVSDMENALTRVIRDNAPAGHTFPSDFAVDFQDLHDTTVSPLESPIYAVRNLCERQQLIRDIIIARMQSVSGLVPAGVTHTAGAAGCDDYFTLVPESSLRQLTWEFVADWAQTGMAPPFNLRAQSLSRLYSNDLEGLPHIAALDLSDNALTDIGDGIFSNNSAGRIRLNGNPNLGQLRGEWWTSDSRESVNHVEARDIGLTFEIMESDEVSMDLWTGLNHLDLSENDIGAFHRDWLADDSTALTELLLSDTGMHGGDKPHDPYDGLDGLMFLDMGENPDLEFINLHWFEELTSLNAGGTGDSLRMHDSVISGYFYDDDGSFWPGGADGCPDLAAVTCPPSYSGDAVALAAAIKGTIDAATPSNTALIRAAWEEFPPLFDSNLCNRQAPVRDAILQALHDHAAITDYDAITGADCATGTRRIDVTPSHLNMLVFDATNPLDLSDSGLTQWTSGTFLHLTGLTHLDLSNKDDDPANDNDMPEPPSSAFQRVPVTHLWLANNPNVGDIKADWWQTDTRSTVHTLHVPNIGMTNTGYLNDFSALRVLEIGHNAVGTFATGWVHPSARDSLEHLGLANTGLSGTSLRHDAFSLLTGLQFIDLGDNPRTDPYSTTEGLRWINLAWFVNKRALGTGGGTDADHSVRLSGSDIDFYFYDNDGNVPPVNDNRCIQYLSGAVQCVRIYDGDAATLASVLRTVAGTGSMIDATWEEFAPSAPGGLYNLCDRTRAVTNELARDMVNDSDIWNSRARAAGMFDSYTVRTRPDNSQCGGIWRHVHGIHLDALTWPATFSGSFNIEMDGITAFQTGDFERMGNMHGLRMDGNPVTNDGMPDGLFDGVDLQFFRARNTFLRYPDADWFDDDLVANLRLLFMSNSVRGEDFPVDALDGMTGLEMLDLRDNLQLRFLNMRWFEFLPNLGNNLDSSVQGNGPVRLRNSRIDGWFRNPTSNERARDNFKAYYSDRTDRDDLGGTFELADDIQEAVERGHMLAGTTAPATGGINPRLQFPPHTRRDVCGRVEPLRDILAAQLKRRQAGTFGDFDLPSGSNCNREHWGSVTRDHMQDIWWGYIDGAEDPWGTGLDLGDKGLTELHAHEFVDLNRLNTLILANRDDDPSNDNTITSLQDRAWADAPVRHVDMTGMSGVGFDRGWWNQDAETLRGVQRLRLRGVGLTASDMTGGDAAFTRFENLRELDLSDNPVGTFQGNWLHTDAHVDMQELVLDNTDFDATEFAYNTFDRMVNLVYVSLQNNRDLGFINVRWFQRLVGLDGLPGEGFDATRTLHFAGSLIERFFYDADGNAPPFGPSDFCPGLATTCGQARFRGTRDEGRELAGAIEDAVKLMPASSVSVNINHQDPYFLPDAQFNIDQTATAIAEGTASAVAELTAVAESQRNICERPEAIRDIIVTRLRSANPGTYGSLSVPSGATCDEMEWGRVRVVDLHGLRWEYRPAASDPWNEALDLGDMGLSTLPMGAFADLRGLDALVLSNRDADMANDNSFASPLPDGVFGDAPITHLNLNGLSGIKVDRDWWEDGNAGDVLTLHARGVGLVAADMTGAEPALTRFASLRDLDLSDNAVGTFQPAWLHSVARASLQFLKLDNTGFMGMDFPFDGFDDFGNLVSLYLKRNANLGFINVRWFQELEELDGAVDMEPTMDQPEVEVSDPPNSLQFGESVIDRFFYDSDGNDAPSGPDYLPGLGTEYLFERYSRLRDRGNLAHGLEDASREVNTGSDLSILITEPNFAPQSVLDGELTQTAEAEATAAAETMEAEETATFEAEQTATEEAIVEASMTASAVAVIEMTAMSEASMTASAVAATLVALDTDHQTSTAVAGVPLTRVAATATASAVAATTTATHEAEGNTATALVETGTAVAAAATEAATRTTATHEAGVALTAAVDADFEMTVEARRTRQAETATQISMDSTATEVSEAATSVVETATSAAEMSVTALASATQVAMTATRAAEMTALANATATPTPSPLDIPHIERIQAGVSSVSINTGDTVRLSVDVFDVDGFRDNSLAEPGHESGLHFRWSDGGAGGSFNAPSNRDYVEYRAPSSPGTFTVSVVAMPDGICITDHDDPDTGVVQDPNRSDCRASIQVLVSRQVVVPRPPPAPINPSGIIPDVLVDNGGTQYAVFTPREGGTFTGDGVSVSAASGAVPNSQIVGITMRQSSIGPDGDLAGASAEALGTRLRLGGGFYDVLAIQSNGSAPLSRLRLNEGLTVCLPLPSEFGANLSDVTLVARTPEGALGVLSSNVVRDPGGDGSLSVCGRVSLLPATVSVARLGIVAPTEVPPVDSTGVETPDTGAVSLDAAGSLRLLMLGSLAIVFAAVLVTLARGRRPERTLTRF